MLFFWTFLSLYSAVFINNNTKIYQEIRIFSEASYDWSNDTKKFSFEIKGINYILKYK